MEPREELNKQLLTHAMKPLIFLRILDQVSVLNAFTVWVIFFSLGNLKVRSTAAFVCTYCVLAMVLRVAGLRATDTVANVQPQLAPRCGQGWDGHTAPSAWASPASH